MRSSELAYAMFFLILFAFIGAVILNRNDAQDVKGNLVRQTRQVPDFTRLRLDGVFEVYLKQGNAASVQIEARAGLLDRISTQADGNELTLKLKRGRQLRNTNIKVYVTVRNLEKVTLNGVTSVETEGFLHLQQLELEHQSVSSAKLALQCDQLIAYVTGVGSLTLEGEGRDVTFHSTGVGEINAADFAADVVRVENTGVGNVSVNARREVIIRSTGVGSVRYKGLAKVKELHRSGPGSVERI